MKSKIRHLLVAMAVVLPLAAPSLAATANPAMVKAPINIQDAASLQRGAQIFTNYCLSCHSASAMRYNRLMDIGLSEEAIKKDILPEGAKIGDLMHVNMTSQDAKDWFGAAPPDLSLIARSRGADYIYSYLRSFYRDPSRPTGWNNAIFPQSGMPNIFWDWQGEQVEKVSKNAQGHEVKQLLIEKPGSLTKVVGGKVDTAEFDSRMADLTNFLVFVGEPGQVQRHQIGYGVLFFLGLLLFPLVYFLKKEYWRDVH